MRYPTTPVGEIASLKMSLSGFLPQSSHSRDFLSRLEPLVDRELKRNPASFERFAEDAQIESARLSVQDRQDALSLIKFSRLKWRLARDCPSPAVWKLAVQAQKRISERKNAKPIAFMPTKPVNMSFLAFFKEALREVRNFEPAQALARGAPKVAQHVAKHLNGEKAKKGPDDSQEWAFMKQGGFGPELSWGYLKQSFFGRISMPPKLFGASYFRQLEADYSGDSRLLRFIYDFSAESMRSWSFLFGVKNPKIKLTREIESELYYAYATMHAMLHGTPVLHEHYDFRYGEYSPSLTFLSELDCELVLRASVGLSRVGPWSTTFIQTWSEFSKKREFVAPVPRSAIVKG